MKRVRLFRLNKLFILGLIFSLFSSLLNLVIPLQIKNTIDLKNLINNKIGLGLIFCIVLFLILSALINTISNFIISREGDKQIAKIRIRVQEHLLRLPISFFNINISGQLSSRVINDSYVVKNFMTTVIPQLINNLITIVGTFSLLLLLDWKMTFIVLCSFPLLVLVILPLGKITENISLNSQKMLSKLTGITTESFQEIRSIKLSGSEDTSLDKFRKYAKKLLKLSVREDFINSIINPIESFLSFGVIIAIIMYGAMRVSNGTLTIGTLVSIVIYFFNVMPAMDSLAGFYTNYKKARGATNKISNILNIKTESMKKNEIVTSEDSHKTLKLRQTYFGYNHNFVLKNINMNFPDKKKIALVGPSGAGKTTIINIITRLYNINKGQLLLGNKNAYEYNLKNWRSLFSVVTQENSIINGTIIDNLTFGIKEDVPIKKLNNILKEVNLLDVINSLPNGLKTTVGEKGVKLSGGQRQRLQIARAYLQKSRFIIFDEATSNLDADSEHLIGYSMNKLSKEKTVIAIAHRLSTITDSDCIYFIANNKILANGTHSYLMKNLPEYRKFVQEQMLYKK